MALAYDQQTVQARSSGVDSLQQTTAQAVDAGDLIVACASTFFSAGTAGTWVVEDDAAQTYSEASDVGADASSFVGIFYKENHPGGSIKVTVNPDGTTADIDFTLSEVSGAAASGSLDKAVEATGALPVGGDTATVATGVLAQANEIIFGIATHNAATRTLTTGTGFTLIGENENNSTGQCHHAEYQIVASTSSVDVQVVMGAAGNSGTWAICAATFKEAAAANLSVNLAGRGGLAGAGGLAGQGGGLVA